MNFNSSEQLKNILEQIVIPKSSIGIHGIRYNSKATVTEIADSIIDNGLIVNQPYGLVGTLYMMDQIENSDFETCINYVFGSDKDKNSINVVCAIPETITMSNGDEYYIGIFPEYTTGYGKNDEKSTSIPFNNFYKAGRIFPKEFIVGYVKKYSNGNKEFILNKNYIGLKSEEERLEFFEYLRNQLDRMHCYKVEEGDLFLATVYSSRTYYQESFIEYYNNKNKTK